MSKRLLSYGDLRELKGVTYSKSHIFRLVAAGKFPKPVSGGGKANCWLEVEIDRYIDSLIAARDSTAA